MPPGLLVTGLLLGLCTAAALAPVRRPRALGLLSYGLGLVVNEVPQLAAALLLASVGLAALQGDLEGPGALAVTALSLLVLAGLAVVARRGLRARGAVAAALPDAEVGRNRWPDVLRTLARPIPVRGRAVVRVADLSYGEHRRQRLDVYHHRSRPAGAPVLVHFHGGGYFSGGKHREARALLHRFAARGWVCVSAGYRLRPTAGFPDHLVDAKRALAWARAHAGEYGGDATTLVAAGSSAGGHLAVLAALTPNDPVLQPGFEQADTSLSAALGSYGYYGRYYGRDEHESPPSTPLAYDAAGAPAVWLAHGDRDTYVHVESARALARHLRAASSSPVVLAELPGGQHGFDLFRSLRYEAVLDGAEAFLDRVLPDAVPPRSQEPRRGRR